MAPAGIRYTYPSVARAPFPTLCQRAVIEYARAQQNMIILHKGKTPPPPSSYSCHTRHRKSEAYQSSRAKWERTCNFQQWWWLSCQKNKTSKEGKRSSCLSPSLSLCFHWELRSKFKCSLVNYWQLDSWTAEIAAPLIFAMLSLSLIAAVRHIREREKGGRRESAAIWSMRK